MNNLDWFNSPVTIREPGANCTTDNCVAYAWDMMITRANGTPPPDSCGSTTISATPQSKDVFRFRVPEDVFGLVHVVGWEIPCSRNPMQIKREFVCLDLQNRCNIPQVMVRDYPQNKGFGGLTILPPGLYRTYPAPTKVNVSEDKIGGVFKLGVGIEYVGAAFPIALNATAGS